MAKLGEKFTTKVLSYLNYDLQTNDWTLFLQLHKIQDTIGNA
jgi:hypothetical protein